LAPNRIKPQRYEKVGPKTKAKRCEIAKGTARGLNPPKHTHAYGEVGWV